MHHLFMYLLESLFFFFFYINVKKKKVGEIMEIWGWLISPVGFLSWPELICGLSQAAVAALF